MSFQRITPPPIERLVMHVHVGYKRVYSGVVDREKPAPEWIAIN